MIECLFWCIAITILLTITTAARNEDALSYDRVRGLYFLAAVFAPSILILYFNLAYFVIVNANSFSLEWRYEIVVLLLIQKYINITFCDSDHCAVLLNRADQISSVQ